MTTNRLREMTAILRTGACGLHRLVIKNGGAMRVPDLADFFGCHRTDKNLRLALERVTTEGYYKWIGSTKDRRVLRLAPLRVARLCEKCGSRRMNEIDWRCGSHPGSTVDQDNRPYDDPRVDWEADPKAVLGVGERPDGDLWPAMAARAAAVSAKKSGGSIGGSKREKAA